MPRVNKKDFVELDYTGRIKNGVVFDTTILEEARENNIYNEKIPYLPAIVCIGENQIIRGLDKYLEGRAVGEEYEVTLNPDESFGKKDAKLLRIVPMSLFKKQNIHPFPGLQLNIDGIIGTVRTVTGGRAVVDFNHPLAGRDIIYKIRIRRIVKDIKEKISAYLKTQLQITNASIELKEDTASIGIEPQLPEEITSKLKEKLLNLTGLKEINFIKDAQQPEPDKDTANPEQAKNQDKLQEKETKANNNQKKHKKV